MRGFGQKAIAQLFIVSLFSLQSFATSTFPTGPDVRLTPGSVCTHPDTYRYPEKVAYCVRNVSGDLKRQVIADYNSKLGYHIEAADRQQFKIDHYIPLCAGGSNDYPNLWPQHKTVYEITDPMEPLICQRMSEGKLLQKHAIELIQEGKNHLDQVPRVMAELQAM